MPWERSSDRQERRQRSSTIPTIVVPAEPAKPAECCFCALKAPRLQRPGGKYIFMHDEKNLLFLDKNTASPLGNSFMPNFGSDLGQFWPFPYLALFSSYRTRFDLVIES